MGFVIIVDKANGNESVGTMWQETYSFDGGATLNEVLKKINGGYEPDYTKEKITITKSQNI